MARTIEISLQELGVSISEKPAQEIWEHPVWVAQREAYKERKAWYDGDEWKRVTRDSRDPSGDYELQWPLQINPIAKVCRIHRAVMLGMQKEIVDEAPISTLVSRSGLTGSAIAVADTLQRFIGKCWRHSHASSTQFEAALLLQIYGGHVFRVAWEPFNRSLPYRIAIHSLTTPAYFFAKSYNPFDRWDLLDAYIGYEIATDIARSKYGITPKNDKADTVLYMEHWTKQYYRVTVDDQVPSFRIDNSPTSSSYAMEGENTWGVIPIVYIPHERDGDFLGRSLINADSSLIGLSKELNARMADKGEAVQDSKPLMWARNTRTGGSWVMREVVRDGQTVFSLLDIGASVPLPGAQPPELGIVESRGLPTSVASYDEELWAEIRRQADVASVAMGDDDTASGRITGPVTAYRMWPTMMHTMSERSFFSTGLAQVGNIIARVAEERSRSSDEGYAAFGLELPGITEEMLSMDLITGWRPMIPIEESQRIEQLNARLAAGGISLYSYLTSIGVQNVEEEEARVWADREREAKLEAQVKEAGYENQRNQDR